MFIVENWGNYLVVICENWSNGLVVICNTHGFYQHYSRHCISKHRYYDYGYCWWFYNYQQAQDKNCNHGLCLLAKIGTTIWWLFAKIGTTVWCLFAIRQISISKTAGIASANTEINVKGYWCTVQSAGSARMVWR